MAFEEKIVTDRFEALAQRMEDRVHIRSRTGYAADTLAPWSGSLPQLFSGFQQTFSIRKYIDQPSEGVFEVFTQLKPLSLVITLEVLPIERFRNLRVGLKSHGAEGLTIFN